MTLLSYRYKSPMNSCTQRDKVKSIELTCMFNYMVSKSSQAKLVSTYLKKFVCISMQFLIGIVTNPTSLPLKPSTPQVS